MCQLLLSIIDLFNVNINIVNIVNLQISYDCGIEILHCRPICFNYVYYIQGAPKTMIIPKEIC